MALRQDKEDASSWQLSAMSCYHDAHIAKASHERIELFAVTTMFKPVPQQDNATQVTSLFCMRLVSVPNDVLLRLCMSDEVKRLAATRFALSK
jgi:hypothetical protein